jgi:hypothetical protein
MSDIQPMNPLPYGNKENRYGSLDEWITVEKGAGYDLQGYIGKYGIPDQSKGQHLTDEFKLPNHITFSDHSMYHNDKTPGGKWEQKDKVWHYTPSDFVIKQHGTDKLRDYFKTNEPNSVLHLPGN